MNGSRIQIKLDKSADKTYMEYFVSEIDNTPIGNMIQVIVPDTALWFLPNRFRSDIGALRLSNGHTVQAQMANFGISLSFYENLESEIEYVSASKIISSVGDIGFGCEYLDPLKYFGKFIVVKRGKCTFPIKAFWAQEAGAKALLVISDDETLISMEQSSKQWDFNLENGVDMTWIPCFFLTKSGSTLLFEHSDSKVVLNGPPETSNLFYSKIKISNLLIKAKRTNGNILKKGYLYPGQSFRCMKKCMAYICC